ncbi:hypothetical protein [Dickeya zeae]|nr:hypothetical protein [Dickeya zeae]
MGESSVPVAVDSYPLIRLPAGIKQDRNGVWEGCQGNSWYDLCC